MLRLRRYRVFLAFAVVSVLLFYHFFSSSETWPDLATKLAGHKTETEDGEPLPDVLKPPIPESGITRGKSLNLDSPSVKEKEKPLLKNPSPVEDVKPVQKKPPPPPLVDYKKVGHVDPKKGPYEKPKHEKPKIQDGATDREQAVPGFDLDPSSTSMIANSRPSAPSIHWKKQKEHYPVSSTISLPAGSPKPVPRIQHIFGRETPEQKADREIKLASIKEAFTHSWNGYREYAWMQDELRPVSNTSRNPFAGWGATLVDALDTLWIMDLKTEFEEAVQAVGKIDFTTSFRKDIPLFETTIRYLGGLVAAYDISGRKEEYRVLLDKAVELAEILMGSFDTPNRMPVTYYNWMPSSASKAQQASTNVVLAELGSLSLEFTRLAQLTKESKYYDAVARITDALEEWQDTTRLPGMWPLHVDASGCKKLSTSTDGSPPVAAHPPMKPGTSEALDAEIKSGRYVKRQLDDPLSLSKAASPEDSLAFPDTHANSVAPTTKQSLAAAPTPSASPLCIPQGLTSAGTGYEQYSLGGMSDSLYEYLPKQQLLLGSLVSSYRTMYEKSIDVVKQKLLFRPMTPPGTNDVLFAGIYSLPPERDMANAESAENAPKAELQPKAEHLTCFAGGMFALGAKIFDRPDELAIAEKLTEGCVWAYGATETGIMPETFLLIPCEGGIEDKCAWNETRWHESLDPMAQGREKSYERQMAYYSSQVSAAYAKASESAARASDDVAQAATPTAQTVNIGTSGRYSQVEKRQLGSSSSSSSSLSTETPSRTGIYAAYSDTAAVATIDPIIGSIFKPLKPLSHTEYVAKRIKDERIPKGFNSITTRNYLLRPEAIESVWYMYRITGSPHWRQVGWTMFQSIQTHCRARHGYSAIDDVTKPAPAFRDEMESFWLAETLKYFYLLFEDEEVLSLDEWVLNTEAHAFRRPDASAVAAV
ncbi:glycoside hydrolase family 47 protein [Saccharata proteae CBS 121410]|uniref:alpha-1,2-Mannosidase n=1 Tax=Saccharata proteae CBS 121410 TaxID=1314787 RepID=A0A9P4LWB5_9PEZI|nr:glycoside hydrolase family 47 protein [Saccharata proteae CBS 121410]